MRLDDPRDQVGAGRSRTSPTSRSASSATAPRASARTRRSSPGSCLSNPARVWNPRELASYGLGQPRDDASPAAAYRDSDAGYVLLGLALERATGRSAAEPAAGLRGRSARPRRHRSSRRAAAAAPSTTAPVLNGHHSLPDAAGVMNCAEPLDVTSLSASTGFTDSGVVSNIARSRPLRAGARRRRARSRGRRPVRRTRSPCTRTHRRGTRPAAARSMAGSLIGQFGAVPGYATAAFSDPATGLTVAVVLNNSGGGAALRRAARAGSSRRSPRRRPRQRRRHRPRSRAALDGAAVPRRRSRPPRSAPHPPA